MLDHRRSRKKIGIVTSRPRSVPNIGVLAQGPQETGSCDREKAANPDKEMDSASVLSTQYPWLGVLYEKTRRLRAERKLRSLLRKNLPCFFSDFFDKV